MAQTRRQFLVHTGCGALSAAALLSGLGRFALVDALAQSGTPLDYKALVCVFLFGGNDANNVVIPFTNYSDYGNVRGTSNIAISQADLLQINPPSTGGLTFGLHPSFQNGFMGSPSLYDLLVCQWSEANWLGRTHCRPNIRGQRSLPGYHFHCRCDYLQYGPEHAAAGAIPRTDPTEPDAKTPKNRRPARVDAGAYV